MVYKMKKTKKKSNFIFDIRAYHSGEGSGHYVFKTNDADSQPYNHTITKVFSQRGQHL